MKIIAIMSAVLLTGCVTGDRMVRIIETGAAGEYIPFVDAQVRGIRIETSDEPPAGVEIFYYGTNGSTVEYYSE